MRLQSWLTVLQQHQVRWSVAVFALWALILAILSFSNALLLSKVVEIYASGTDIQRLVGLMLILNVFLGLGFGSSAYGLWRQYNWGRVLFLWLLVTWSLVNVVALFAPGVLGTDNPDYSETTRVLKGIRFTVGPAVSLWYFNLARVKDLFGVGNTKNFGIEETKIE